MKLKIQINRKTISVISYITILGWIISFALYNKGGKSSLAKYHLKQSFGLGVLGTLFSITSLVIIPNAPINLFIIAALGIVIFLTAGIINAINLQKKPIPLIGSFFIDRFYFI